MTRILLVNIPTAEMPTDYPPVAISRVIDGLDPSLACGASFLNLDYYRPDFDGIRSTIQSFSPDIIGISVILTPTYAYLKQLSTFIKTEFPTVIQVTGGEATVLSNMILSKTGVDFCCIGESEPTFSNLIRRLQQEDFTLRNMQRYADIKGLVFRLNGTPHFTGYEVDRDENALRQFNYKLISQFTNIDHYFQKMPGQYFGMRISGDHNIKYFLDQLYPGNRDKRMATVFTSKGCVAKCTFCHRFLKGYRVNEVEGIINYVENLRRDFDVGMILFQEENFGSDKKSTAKLVEYLGSTGLNWAATATRATTVTEESAGVWRQAGCVHINSGLEHASQKMLDVMEKRTSVQDNLNYLKRCSTNKIFTVVGLLIGMPGETEETIEEGITNFSSAISDDMKMPFEMYVNYVQAIPGTPLYEYARRYGLLGQSLEDEERYIESLYDVNACELDHYLNFTDYPKEKVAYWQVYVRLELLAAYVRKHGCMRVLKYNGTLKRIKCALVYSLFPKTLRKLLLKYMMAMRYFGVGGVVRMLRAGVFGWKEMKFSQVNTSIRRINKGIPLVVREDDPSTGILREGR